jgi:hypothetical protein
MRLDHSHGDARAKVWVFSAVITGITRIWLPICGVHIYHVIFKSRAIQASPIISFRLWNNRKVAVTFKWLLHF